ncbi:hypothetical protein NCC49_005618 [Naganishia albida]|nr:hypothetical protein NCC49_005618 [Naganishia albida]
MRRIRQALSPAQVEGFAPILKGISEDRKYTVRTQSADEYFVKLFDSAAGGFIALKARNEIEWTVWAAERGFGPKVVFSSMQQGIMITHYLNNEMDLDEEGMLEPRLSASLARLRSVHSSDIPAHSLRYPAREAIFGWKEAYAKLSLQQTQMPLIQLGTRIVDASIHRLSASPHKVVPVHGDFHQWNVMFAKGISWLVDWTWGGIGDAMQDLAYYAYHADLHGLKQFEGMLRKYDPALSRADIDRAKCHFALTHARFYIEVLLTASPDKAQWRKKRLGALEADLVEDGQWLELETTIAKFAGAAIACGSTDPSVSSCRYGSKEDHDAPTAPERIVISPKIAPVPSAAPLVSDGIETRDLQRIQQVLSSTRIISCESIVLGLSGDHKFRVTDTEHEQYFVKIFGIGTGGSSERVASNEISLSLWAGSTGLGPHVVAYDLDQGILITRYLNNEMGNWNEGGKEPRLSATLSTMRSLHASKATAVPFGRAISGELTHWVEECDRTTSHLKELGFLAYAREIVDACAGRLTENPPSGFSICHNDCHQANVRFSLGKAWLVDWATGGPGDPMKEVAYFAYHIGIHGFADLEALLEKYGSTLSQEDTIRAKCYFAWTHAYRYLEALRNVPHADDQERTRKLQVIEADLLEDGLWLGLERVSLTWGVPDPYFARVLLTDTCTG